MTEILALDIMNHPYEVDRSFWETAFEFKEFQIMTKTTFKSVFKGEIPTADQLRSTPALAGHSSIEAMIATMDQCGYDRVVITATKMWSYYWHHKLIMDYSIDHVGELVDQGKGRVIGAASYNPFRIDDSLREIERGVREYGFKYVWFHPLSFGLAPNDRRFYPLYAKCVELDIAVGMQVGHSAEVLPSAVGRPVYVDDVAIEFPTLRINLSHTGWPWVDEFCSMIWRHPNVWGDISAYFATSLDEGLLQFMDSGRGRDRILFGTNGLGLQRCREEFDKLPLKDVTRQKVLRDNCLEFLKVD